jgi:hypothetical protein
MIPTVFPPSLEHYNKCTALGHPSPTGESVSAETSAHSAALERSNRRSKFGSALIDKDKSADRPHFNQRLTFSMHNGAT